jgi:erythromycin esterase-like protein
LGLGEPMHGEAEFPRLRNQVFRQLVEREGYRSIAIESDCLAALTVDAYVTKGEGSLDDVMETGFSHGFGELGANRQLVTWMRQYNRRRDAADKIRFYGFDAPMEMSGAASPRQALTALHDYLASHLEAALLPCTLETIDRLIGDDERWTNPAAAMDPSQSIGTSREANELRLVTDDLVAALTSQSPRLIAATSHAEWRRACLYGRTAAGLLRYHATMADTSDSRVAQLLGERDAMMAANLQAIVAHEAQRGPTLVFAHNRHLQKDLSTWQLEGMALSWWSAGAIAAAQIGDQYAFLASALGSAADQGLDAPKPDTLEGALSAIAESRCIFNSRRLAETLRGMGAKLTLRTDTSTNHGYFALDPDQLDGTDGVIFIKDIPSGSQRIRTGDASDANPQECRCRTRTHA